MKHTVSRFVSHLNTFSGHPETPPDDERKVIMAIELTICNTRFHDAQLRDATERINRYAGEILRNGFAIGATMATVESTHCYENDGFKSTVEWAMKSFNLKKSAVYNYLKIGKDFTREIVSNKGKTTGYCSNLLKIPGTDIEVLSYNTEPAPAPEKDFTPSQIERLLPVGREMAVELVREGVITPEMSCKDIQRAVKTLTAETDDSETESPDPETASTRTRKRNLSKIATVDLIAELETRGYIVYEYNAGVLTPIGVAETVPDIQPVTVPGDEKGGE